MRLIAHLVKPVRHPEGAQLLAVGMRCRACGRGLDLLEMHFLADPEDGSATCSPCEEAWSVAMDSWRHGDGPMPIRP